MNRLVSDDLNENQISVKGDESQCVKNPSLIIENEDEAKEIYNYMKSLLEPDDYERISDIFYHICTSKDFQYKILVTRRAYLLYEIFAVIFSFVKEARPNHEAEFQIEGKIYNSHSLPLLSTLDAYTSDAKKERYLIFDDIIVHGRAISKTFEKLKSKNIDSQNISVWCLLKKKDANCLLDEVNKRITVYRSCDSEAWKTLSDKLTNIVVRHGGGYTSYVDTYRFVFGQEQETKEKFKRIFLNLHNKGNYKLIHLHMSEKFDVKSFIVLENKNISNSNEISCVRFYQYQHYLIVAPYVFLATVKTEDAFSYAVKVLEDNGISTFLHTFNSIIRVSTHLYF